jgi:chemotaxis protein methyltransferase CheR
LSAAILFEELTELIRPEINYRIFAVDGCDHQIGIAREGRFLESSLGNVGLKRLNQWFTKKTPHEYIVAPRLLNRIEFSVSDMLNNTVNNPPSSIFGSFDIVFCCNLLLYYKPPFRKIILDKLARSLGCGAYLVTGETERGYMMENGFQEVYAQAAIFQKIKKIQRSEYHE